MTDRPFDGWLDGKIDLALFHLKQYTQRWPDDYKMTVNYVNVLRQKDLLVPPFRRAATEKASADEAWKALCRTEPYLTDGSYTETHGDLSVLKGGRGSVVESSHVNQFYFDMVWTALSSGQESQVALDLALKITTENAHDMKMARDALEHISTTLRKRSPLNDNKADLEVNVRAMKALLELSPDDVELISWAWPGTIKRVRNGTARLLSGVAIAGLSYRWPKFSVPAVHWRITKSLARKMEGGQSSTKVRQTITVLRE